MKTLPQKPIIKQQIANCMQQFRAGDTLRTDDVYRYVKRRTGMQFYPDTVLRYLREMRRDGVINYNCNSKADRVIKIIPPGAPHSI